MEEAHHQCAGGYAIWTCHINNTEEGVQYRTTKMIFYRQFYCNPDFILLWLNPDVAEIPSGC